MIDKNEAASAMIRFLYNLPKPRLESLKFLAMLMAYDSTGSWTKTAEFLGVSHRTLNDWRRAAQKRQGIISLMDSADADAVTEILDVKEIGANESMLAEYRAAEEQVERIWELLELCQTRCRNAVNFYNSGHCPTSEKEGKEDYEQCFSARLQMADARVLSKQLVVAMREILGMERME